MHKNLPTIVTEAERVHRPTRPSSKLQVFDSLQAKRTDVGVQSYELLFHALEPGSRWKTALEYFDAMGKSRVEPDTPCFNALINVCAASGKVCEALS